MLVANLATLVPAGFAGIDTPRSYNDKTAMVFCDAKASVCAITEELKAVS
jgi:NAD(P) transhydrogenase subunit beta